MATTETHFVPTVYNKEKKKACVNLSRARNIVKITSHVPVIPHGSRKPKTKFFMRGSCVLGKNTKEATN